ncbi:MAG: IS200/IS605 family element transposase accessory protein TnpB [Ardenticatenales bacterium]|nr:IS200/IS605 family element transposase accessory protein TnpB [Ardenticatenales bacterium]
MIRTHIIPCQLAKEQADAFNLASGRVYTGVLISHWRVVRKKRIWLSEKAGTRWSDHRTTASLHAHSIDAAQQGFYKACRTTRALRKAGYPEAKYPHWPKKFRTTIWKNTAIKHEGQALLLSNGRGNEPITLLLPNHLGDVLRVLEVRLVYDKRARRYTWHLVVENGKQSKAALGSNVVSVDLGEVHPAVVGDEHESVMVTCRERRHEQQGHAKRLATLSRALSRKKKGSRRYKKLVRAKSRMKAKHKRVMRDMEHKVSRAIVEVAVERAANTLVIGDVRDIADEVALGKRTNQKISGWNHGKIRAYTTYKAEAEGIVVVLQEEHYTSQTCPTPSCRQRHKPRGRTYRCPSCGFQSHRDVVGQVNILSSFKYGAPGHIPTPPIIKHRMPHNLRLMRRRRDTGQALAPVARRSSGPREAAGL